jgi:hypothetical protein
MLPQQFAITEECWKEWKNHFVGAFIIVELSRPEICHLVGVREEGKQSDESIFRKIGVFNRLKIS